MPLPYDLIDLPAPAGARWLARERLADAASAAARLGGGDVEALHDCRVALRRLRTLLRAYRPWLAGSVRPRDLRRLRDVTAATGASRDVEVQRAWLDEQLPTLAARHRAGVQWLQARLRDDGAQGERAGLEAVRAYFAGPAPKLARRLSRYTQRMSLDEPRAPVSFASVTATAIRDAADRLASRLGEVHDLADQEPAHDARIAGKRLRYVLEPVVALGGEAGLGATRVLQALRALQEALGTLNDAHVLGRTIAEAYEQAAAAQERALSEAVLGGEEPVPARRRVRRDDPRPGMLALAQRVRTRGAAAWGIVAGSWLDGAAASFLADVGTVADALDAMAHDGVEIERKYLLSALPARLAGAPASELDQGYLPGARLVERVRRVRTADGTERYFRTVKGGQGVRRLEIEEATTREVFDALWPLTAGCRVRKRRYRVEEGDRTWEVDEFLDRPLVLAEIELASEDEAVDVPAWLAGSLVRDVTLDRAYGNRTLAR